VYERKKKNIVEDREKQIAGWAFIFDPLTV
jgi:hypothetical protein